MTVEEMKKKFEGQSRFVVAVENDGAGAELEFFKTLEEANKYAEKEYDSIKDSHDRYNKNIYIYESHFDELEEDAFIDGEDEPEWGPVGDYTPIGFEYSCEYGLLIGQIDEKEKKNIIIEVMEYLYDNDYEMEKLLKTTNCKYIKDLYNFLYEKSEDFRYMHTDDFFTSYTKYNHKGRLINAWVHDYPTIYEYELEGIKEKCEGHLYDIIEDFSDEIKE